MNSNQTTGNTSSEHVLDSRMANVAALITQQILVELAAYSELENRPETLNKGDTKLLEHYRAKLATLGEMRMTAEFLAVGHSAVPECSCEQPEIKVVDLGNFDEFLDEFIAKLSKNEPKPSTTEERVPPSENKAESVAKEAQMRDELARAEKMLEKMMFPQGAKKVGDEDGRENG